MNRKLTAGIIFIALFFGSCSSLRFWEQREELVVLSTTMGDMVVRLYDEAPLHKENFQKLVKENFYDSLIFHRVINEFMIQGGATDSRNAPPGIAVGAGPESDIGYRIENEFDPEIPHKRGVIAAARDQNPEKASSGSQFFIAQGKIFTDEDLDQIEAQFNRQFPEEHREIYKTTGGIPHLYFMEFTVFGEVIEGLDVLDKIAATPTDHRDRPRENVIMNMRMVRR